MRATWIPEKRRPAKETHRPTRKRLPPGPVITNPVFGEDTGPLHPDHARFRSYDPPLVLECRQGQQRFRITGGYGGFEEIERPEMTPITQWKGSPGYRMEGQLLIDGLASETSVENGIAILERMGRDPGGDSAPPNLRVRLPSGSPRSPHIDWVIEDLDWDEESVILNGAGQRIRQLVTVKLMQYEPPDAIKEAKRRKKKKSKRRPKIHTVPRGHAQSLYDIAKKYRLKWQAIAKLNPGIRDPRRELRAGTKVKLP